MPRHRPLALLPSRCGRSRCFSLVAFGGTTERHDHVRDPHGQHDIAGLEVLRDAFRTEPRMVDRSVCVGDRPVLVVHPVKVEWLDVDDHGFFLAQHVTSLPHRCAASTTRAPGPRDATHRGLENETIHPMVSGTAREEAVGPGPRDFEESAESYQCLSAQRGGPLGGSTSSKFVCGSSGNRCGHPPSLKPPILMLLLAESEPVGSRGASQPASAWALLVWRRARPGPVRCTTRPSPERMVCFHPPTLCTS